MLLNNQESLNLLFRSSIIVFCFAFVFKMVIIKLQNYKNSISTIAFIINFAQLISNTVFYLLYLLFPLEALTEYLINNRIMLIALITLIDLLVIIIKSMFYKKYIEDEEDQKKLNGLRLGVIIIKIVLYAIIPSVILSLK